MGSDVRHVRGEAQKELVKKFEVFTSKGRSRSVSYTHLTLPTNSRV